jgi:leader peptidase (prepilin peptidase) / N-methyltransferase
MQPMAGLVALLAGVLGLLVGSFGNVVIHRVPEGRSVVRPPSACPSCGTQLRPLDNVPVLSWLALRGRCRTCDHPISARYPAVELAGGALFALVGWWVARMDPPRWWVLPAMLLYAFVLLVVAVVDAETRRIPNAITYTATPALLVLLVLAALAHGEPGRLVGVLLGGLGAFGFLLLLALANPRGMGMGDVKYAAFLGMGLGWVGTAAVVVGLFSAFLLGAVASVALVSLTSRTRKDLVPFGPYLSAGALLGLLAGPALARAYLSATGLG